MIAKKELRSEILNELKSLDPTLKNHWDQLLCEALIVLIKEKDIKVIHSYIPMANEVNIKPVIEHCWSEDIQVIIPNVEGKGKLSHHVINSFKELKKNDWGLLEPIHKNPSRLKPELVITPGLAFNANKFRLGYGGGYYDRFLNSQTNSVALAYPFMLRNDFVVEQHDIPVRRIISITENKVLELK